MLHVCTDKMACCEGRAEAEFAGEDRGCNDAGQLATIRARSRGVGAAHTEEIEHGCLGREEGAAADCTDFDAWHGDGDLKGAVETMKELV